MQKYIGLLDYTEKEMQQMNEMAERRKIGQQITEARDGELHEIYYTLGSHDAIIIASFPDADAVSQTTFVHGQELGGELQVFPAYTGEEFDELVEHLDETPE